MCSEPFGRDVIMGKYEIQYFRCPNCGLIETEQPYWLPEAYQQPIAPGDVGLLQRSIKAARATQVYISAFSDASGRFVDFGGGYGTLTRLMRDGGYDFYHHDKHCQNLFASGFEVTEGDCDFKVVTAFEVLEHLVDPVAEVAQMVRLAKTILFSTEVAPKEKPPLPGSWWYYAPDCGQHVTLYTNRSLDLLAAKFGLRHYHGAWMHVFTDRQIGRAHV